LVFDFIPAGRLDDDALNDQLRRANEVVARVVADRGGSPGEFWHERLEELNREKAKRDSGGTDKTTLTTRVLKDLYPGPGLKSPVRSFEETRGVADVIEDEIGKIGVPEDAQAEIERLNDELTCASESVQSYVHENERMKKALEMARQAFQEIGRTELADEMLFGITGEAAEVSGQPLPSA
jgi:hypothetical protein